MFPDTYFFTEGMTVESIIAKFLDNFFDKVSGIEELKGITPEKFYDILILASIVEREYRVSEEAPLIASVFVNRINNNIGLYSCATIEYIISEIQKLPHPDRITYNDLKIDNPYNTYKWAGLPPGAISNPGLIALDAATNTPKTNYYFFQVVDAEQGRHVFTSSFEDHVENHLTVTKRAK